MIFKKNLYFIILSLGIFLLVAYIGSFSYVAKSLVSIALYAIFAYFFYHDQIKLAILVTPIFSFYLPLHILLFNDTFASIPSNLAGVLGVTLGVLLAVKKSYYSIIGSLIIALVAIWLSIWGYDFWINKDNFSSFKSDLIEELDSFSFYTIDGKEITQRDFKDKIVILDFWNTACVTCLKKFPELQNHFDTYKSNDNILIYAVNVPLQRDKKDQAQQILTARHYSFPLLFAKEKAILNKFRVTVYPTVIILNKNSAIVYRGRIDNINNTIRSLQVNDEEKRGF